MNTSSDPSAFNFYLHLPIIYNLGILDPFSSFETQLLITANVPPSQVTSNVWSILMDF